MKSGERARETDETRALVGWLRIRGIRHFAVPNGMPVGGRNPAATIGRLKAEGLLPGAPDLVLIDLAPATLQPVAVEMKRRGGGRLSAAQRKVIESMEEAGWIVIVAHGVLDAITELQMVGY